MLLERNQSALLIVDVQSRLAPHVHEHQRVIDNCIWLIDVAKTVTVPVLVSEHYPEGIGGTVAAIRSRVDEDSIMRKDHFSCLKESVCRARIEALPGRQIVVAGMEAHVCVLQTVLSLRAANYEVFLVADSISSRVPHDTALAIERAKAAGSHIVSREMVLFEWVERGATPQFRELHQRFLKADESARAAESRA